MKNIFLIAALLFTAVLNVSAQKQITEGKIVYSITLPDTMKGANAIGKEQVLYFKNGSVRMEVSTMVGTVTVISDSKGDEMYSLMEMMGEKYALKMTEVDLEAFTQTAGKEKPTVKITDEKKKINGYKCTKAIVTTVMEGKPYTTEAWFTKEIATLSAPAMQGKVEGLDGFVMETTTVVQGAKVSIKCTKIETTPVADAMFKVPEGYTIKTMAELMGGMK